VVKEGGPIIPMECRFRSERIYWAYEHSTTIVRPLRSRYMYSGPRILLVYLLRMVDYWISLCINLSSQEQDTRLIPPIPRLDLAVISLTGRNNHSPADHFHLRLDTFNLRVREPGLAFINHHYIENGITKYKTTPKSSRKMSTLSTHIYLFIPILPSTTT
jgi:hypothetical protein